MPWEKRPENSIGLRLDVTTNARDALRIEAAKQGQSLAAYLRSVVMDHVASLEQGTARPSRKRKPSEPTP